MAAEINRSFLQMLDEALLDTNRALKRSPEFPQGEIAEDATSQDAHNHAAIVALTTAVEALHNWASEVTYNLEREGVVEVIRD